MRILILGASGGVGRLLTRSAVARGYDVTAVVRVQTALDAPAQVRVIRGDVTEPALIEQALPGHDVVLSALGLRRGGRSPFAPLLSPPDLTQRVARHLVTSMRRHDVARVLVISAGGVGGSFAQLSWPVKRLVSTGNVAVAHRDLSEMERVLATSGLDWLAVRPVTLVDGPATGRGREVQRYGMLSNSGVLILPSGCWTRLNVASRTISTLCSSALMRVVARAGPQ